MDKAEIAEHNLRVEREGRDHFHKELIQAEVVIASQKRRIAKLEAVCEAVDEYLYDNSNSKRDELQAAYTAALEDKP